MPPSIKAKLSTILYCIILSLLQIGGYSWAESIHLEQKTLISDGKLTNHVVQAKIYPENPDYLYLTMRGGGVSVYDVSNPAAPQLADRWNGDDVEGQDRFGDLLVVIGRCSGKFYTFDASDPRELVLTGQLALKKGVISPCLFFWMNYLHTKLYKVDGKVIALVAGTNQKRIYAVDVSDPNQPKTISSVDTGVGGLESVQIRDGIAYVGGFMSHKLVVIDARDPSHLKIADTLEKDYYKQMVSAVAETDSGNYLMSALWGKPGGLGVFDLSIPEKPKEIAKILRADLHRSNRVKIHNDLVFLPLEQSAAGVGVISIKNPRKPKHLGTFIFPELDYSYTLAVKKTISTFFQRKKA